MDTLRKVIGGLFLLLAALGVVWASGLTPALPNAQLVGQGQFSRFGFSVYQAQLWAPLGRYVSGEPFALSLIYSREISGTKLVQASLDEMQKLQAPVNQSKEWRAALERVLPDVLPGDSITGVYHPGEGAVFFHRNQRTGKIEDELAKYFFAIWLDPRTSEPGLRQALLGERP
ncbi:MAG: chalcone isomerase family protein [Alcaligenaceae bacterium]